MNVIESLSYNEKKLLLALEESGGVSSPERMISSGKFDLEVEVMGAASWLSNKGLATITEDQSKFYACRCGSGGQRSSERRALIAITRPGELSMADLIAALPAERTR